MNAYFNAMKNYANFKGQATRSQYWLYTLILSVALFVCIVVDVSLGIDKKGALIFTGLVNIIHLIPSLAIAVRRLHDTNRSGWWILIAFIPLGIIVLIVFLCLPTAAPTKQTDNPQSVSI